MYVFFAPKKREKSLIVHKRNAKAILLEIILCMKSLRHD